MTKLAPKGTKSLGVQRMIYLLPLLLLVPGLFYIHTVLLFDVAGAMLGTQPWFLERFDPHMTGKLITLVCVVILFVAHSLATGVWALFLRCAELVPTVLEGMYFVGSSVSTLGYGDLVLPKPWRRIGPIIAITGVLKLGCSTAFLFLAMQTLWEKQI